MLTQKKIKFIQSLQKKKFRQKYNLFIVEGEKSVKEILNSSYRISELYATNTFDYPDTTYITENELKKISFLTTPKDVLAVVEIPKSSTSKKNINTLILENIQDPGNFGTILRTADWFGISQVVASEDTVELYNPKAIQASMGSFTRVQVHYENIADFCKNFEGCTYAAHMEGVSIYDTVPEFPYSLIMGNEGNGLSQESKQLATSICIPNFSTDSKAESLNVGIATGVILSEFKRKETL